MFSCTEMKIKLITQYLKAYIYQCHMAFFFKLHVDSRMCVMHMCHLNLLGTYYILIVHDLFLSLMSLYYHLIKHLSSIQ
jgi:hypothetical protein